MFIRFKLEWVHFGTFQVDIGTFQIGMSTYQINIGIFKFGFNLKFTFIYTHISCRRALISIQTHPFCQQLLYINGNFINLDTPKNMSKIQDSGANIDDLVNRLKCLKKR